MSREFTRYFASLTASLLCSFTRIVLPWQAGLDSVLCTTCPSTRQHQGAERDREKKFGFAVGASPTSSGLEMHYSSRYQQSRRQVEILPSSPDRPPSRAPTVSLSTVDASFTQSQSALSTSLATAFPSSTTLPATSVDMSLHWTLSSNSFRTSTIAAPLTAAPTSQYAFPATPLASNSLLTITQPAQLPRPTSSLSLAPLPYTTFSGGAQSIRAPASDPLLSSWASSVFMGVGPAQAPSMDSAGGSVHSSKPASKKPASTPPITSPWTTLPSTTPVITLLSPAPSPTSSPSSSGPHDPKSSKTRPVYKTSSLSSPAADTWRTSSRIRNKTSDRTSSTSVTGHTTPLNLPTTTVIFTTTVTSGRNTVITTVMQTGVLSTDTPKPSRFATNPGAVVGVVLAGTFGVILVIFLLFFGCKRYRARRNNFGSMDNILALARETAYRLPLDGDDDSYLNGTRRSHSPHNGPLPSSQGHATDIEDLRSAEGAPQWSAESAYLGRAVPMSTTFGGQSNIAGMPGSVEASGMDSGPRLSEDRHAEEHDADQVWWGINDPSTLDDPQGWPVGEDEPVPNVVSPSVASLTMVGGASSSSGHAAASAGPSSASRKRNSLPGARPLSSPAENNRRHSSTPPTAFHNSYDSSLDPQHQPISQDQSDKTSVKSFFSRLRTGRRKSAQSTSTIRVTSPQTRGLEELPLFVTPSNAISPSLLNPPIILPPSPAILTFPRGVTGNSYAHPSPQQEQGFARPTSFLWPPVVLPPPSPVLTETSLSGEGLLHPRLSRYGHSQASTASLRDHEDYTRPINAIVYNRSRSTATFETQDTTDSERDGKTPAS